MPLRRARPWGFPSLNRLRNSQVFLLLAPYGRNRRAQFRRCRVARVAVREGQKHAEHGEASNKAETPVTDEWKCDARHRKRARGAADVDDGLKTHEGGKSRRAELREHVARLYRSPHARVDEDYEREYDDRAANESELFGDGRVDVVRVGDGYN